MQGRLPADMFTYRSLSHLKESVPPPLNFSWPFDWTSPQRMKQKDAVSAQTSAEQVGSVKPLSCVSSEKGAGLNSLLPISPAVMLTLCPKPRLTQHKAIMALKFKPSHSRVVSMRSLSALWPFFPPSRNSEQHLCILLESLSTSEPLNISPPNNSESGQMPEILETSTVHPRTRGR